MSRKTEGEIALAQNRGGGGVGIREAEKREFQVEKTRVQMNLSFPLKMYSNSTKPTGPSTQREKHVLCSKNCPCAFGQFNVS